MTEVGFYHLTATALDRALPRLLGKAHEAGMRAVVLAASEERIAVLDAALWTFGPGIVPAPRHVARRQRRGAADLPDDNRGEP